MSDKQLVAVIYGGTSTEREVSLKSGGAVLKALEELPYRTAAYDPKDQLHDLINDAKKINAALVMLHGAGGEDGSMQGFLDLLGIPYQCSGVLGCALAMDKAMAKERFYAAGLNVAPDVVLHRGKERDLRKALEQVGLPMVIKPARQGSSVGISLVRSAEQLEEAVDCAFRVDDLVLAEKYLEGREVTASIIGDGELARLPLVEILPGQRYSFFDYEAKYTPGATKEICPAPIDPEITAEVQEMAVRAHHTLACGGYSRSDFIITEDGPVILELNTIPGMTQTSLLPLAAATAGIGFAQLVDKLVKIALERGKRARS